MGCTHPLKGFQIGLTDRGKPKFMITNHKCHHVEQHSDNKYYASFEKKISKYTKKVIYDSIDIPCGKCIECRLAYSRQWANRCLLELPYHDQSYFLTLTYDDAHLPTNDYVDPDGVVHLKPTLVKKDLQNFWKRLRKNYKHDNHLLYFACGEYGDKRHRPHYHAIVFGLKLDDLQVFEPYKIHQDKNGTSYNYYTSAFLSSIWPYGLAVVGQVNWDTCAYVARYILKKQTGNNAEVYKEFNFSPEFSTMSLKPAIGKSYYDEHGEKFLKYDYIPLKCGDDVLKVRSPRYYDKKFDIDFPDNMVLIKEKRLEISKNSAILKSRQTSKSVEDMLLDEEKNKLEQIKVLKRGVF